jgi:hypothetical protein
MAKQAKPRQKRPLLTDAEILNDIKTKPVVPVWPHYGWAHGCGRNKSYELAQKGGPDEFLRIGEPGKRQIVRAITAPLRKKVVIDAA